MYEEVSCFMESIGYCLREGLSYNDNGLLAIKLLQSYIFKNSNQSGRQPSAKTI